MTADYIAFHAQQRPDASAVHDNDRTIAYGELARDLSKFTHAIRELGIPVGGAVADTEVRSEMDAVLVQAGFRKLILVCLPRLPRDSTGRIDRTALARAMAARASSGEPGAG